MLRLRIACMPAVFGALRGDASLGLYQGFSAKGPSAGVISVDPAGQPCPPCALAYSKVCQLMHCPAVIAVAHC